MLRNLSVMFGGRRSSQEQRPVVMGPCFREDDVADLSDSAFNSALRHCERKRRFHGEWIATGSEARLRLLTHQPGDNDVARSSFRRTGRYPHAVWRNFCVVGTESFELAGDVAVAGQGREDVQTQCCGWRYCGTFAAVCRAQAQGAGADRP